jgi:hypothetical protein
MVHPGLCAACRHARVVESKRGSQFWFCGRSRFDPRFPKYPGLPVLQCIGYEQGTPVTNDAEDA